MKMLVVLIGNWSRFDVISLLAFSIIKHLWNSVRTVLLQGCGNRTFTFISDISFCWMCCHISWSGADVLSLLLWFLSDKVCARIEWANMSDLWGWDWDYSGWRALCCLQWMCFPCLQTLLWVWEKGGKSSLPSVQNQIQTNQRWDCFCNIWSTLAAKNDLWVSLTSDMNYRQS